VDRAALVVEINDAVVVIGVGLGSTAREVNMNVASHWRRFIDVERVVVD